MIFSISCSKDSDGSSARRSAAAPEGDPIKIGVTMPVTGAFANMGIPELEGIMTAAAVINKTGGINGRPLEIIHADVPDVAAAKGETDRLINQRKVTCVVGTYNSTFSLAVAETCNRYNTVYFEISSYGTAISRSGFKTTIRHSPNADQVGQELIDVLVKEIAPGKLGKDVKDLKIAFASEDGVWGTNNVDACLTLLADSGLGDNVVLKEYYAADTKDLSTLVLKMKRAAPDILFLFAYEQDGIMFVKQSKELGFNTPIIAGGGGGLALAGFGEALGSLATGIISLDCAPLPPYSNKNALIGLDEYMEAFKELYGKDAYGIFGHTMYGNFMAFMQILKNAASLSTKDIMASAYATDIPSFQLTSGYGAKYADIGKDLCLNTRAWPYMVQWQKDGHLYTIWPFEAAGTEPLLPKPAF
jgi:branched-chain amino acid transport system substrate-binding protein